MSGVLHIAAFYSRGPHFERMLAELRRQYPEAHLCAMVPRGYPVETLDSLADECWETECSSGSLRQSGALLRLLGAIRRRRFSLFAVMFPSLKLELLARASGAPQRMCRTVDGRMILLNSPLIAVLFGTALRRLRGEITCLRIAWCVRHCPVEKNKQ